MPRGVPAALEKEARIVARLLARPHDSLIARQERRGERPKRLPAERRTAVIEARRANPKATQEEIARKAGVSRSFMSVTGARSSGVSMSPPPLPFLPAAGELGTIPSHGT